MGVHVKGVVWIMLVILSAAECALNFVTVPVTLDQVARTPTGSYIKIKNPMSYYAYTCKIIQTDALLGSFLTAPAIEITYPIIKFSCDIFETCGYVGLMWYKVYAEKDILRMENNMNATPNLIKNVKFLFLIADNVSRAIRTDPLGETNIAYRYCEITEVSVLENDNLLRNNQNLLYIHTLDDHLMELDPSYTFERFPKLEHLYVTRTAIEYLHENLFKPFTDISMIILTRNKIRNVPKGLFQGKSRLRYISLAENHIEFIPQKAFLGTRLEGLNLEGNRLTHLPPLFSSILSPKAKELYFDRNPWQCGCLNEILVDLKKTQIRYYSERYNGASPVCVATTSWNCARREDFYQMYLKLLSANDIL